MKKILKVVKYTILIALVAGLTYWASTIETGGRVLPSDIAEYDRYDDWSYEEIKIGREREQELEKQIDWDEVSNSLNNSDDKDFLDGHYGAVVDFDITSMPSKTASWGIGKEGTAVLTFEWFHEGIASEVAAVFDSDMNLLSTKVFTEPEILIERFEKGEFDGTELFNYDSYEEMLHPLQYQNNKID